MPAFAVEDESLVVWVAEATCGDEFAGFLVNLSLALLAERVLFLEVLGDVGSSHGAIGSEEFDGEPCVAHSAGGVEHGGELESDVEAVEALACEAGGFYQGLYSVHFAVG